MSSEMRIRWSGHERRREKVVDAEWQASVEDEKAALARTLHDRTGGMLVAARMDISWSEKHVDIGRADLCVHLERARRAIDEAIELNRRLIEELHPSLLDNFGLPETLRWYVSSMCSAADIPFNVTCAQKSPVLVPLTAIVFYRIAQSVVSLLVQHQSRSVTLNFTVEDGWATMSLDGSGIHDSFRLEDAKVSPIIASVKSRVLSFGGDMFVHFDEGTLVVSSRIPATTASA